MDKNEIIKLTADYVRKTLEGEGTGHDFWHVLRVWNTAKLIGKKEKAKLFIVELGALLHDIADWKFSEGDFEIGVKKTKNWLNGLGVDVKIIEQVCDIVREISFKGVGVKSKMQTLEGKIVQDADRLDALGAIGVARTFIYGGATGREIYNPNIKPKKHATAEGYRLHKNTVINHFYEKLLLLKDLMNTKTGRKMAEKKHKFMEKFLKQFYTEWNT